MMFSRAFIAPSISASISGVNALNRSRSSLESGLRAEHPDRDHRAVERQRGDDRVEPRAVGQPGVHHRRGLVDPAADPETMRSMICSRCSLSRKTTSDFWIRPSFSTKIFLGPLIMMSPILSSLSSSSSGPKPKVSSRISLTSRWRSLRLSSGFSVSQSCSTTPRISLRRVFGSISLTRFMSSRSTSCM